MAVVTSASLLAYVLIMSIYILIGVPSNLLIIIFYPEGIKSSTSSNFLIKVLAIVDLLNCLLAIPIAIFLQIGLLNKTFLCKSLMALSFSLAACSVTTVGSIALERWLVQFSIERI